MLILVIIILFEFLQREQQVVSELLRFDRVVYRSQEHRSLFNEDRVSILEQRWIVHWDHFLDGVDRSNSSRISF